MQRLGCLLNDIVLAERFLRPAQRFHQRGWAVLEPLIALGGLSNNAVAQPSLSQRVEHLGGGRGAELVGIDRRHGDVGNASPHALAGILQDDLFSVRHVGKLAFNDRSQTAKLEQHIGPVPAVQMNSFRVRGDAEP